LFVSQSRSARIFDHGGFHPNIKRVGRTPWKAYSYCAKDKNLVAGVEFSEEDLGRSIKQTTSAWAEIVESDCEDEFWSRVKRLDPRQLCVSYPSLRKYCDAVYKKSPDRYQHPWGEYNDLDLALQNWISEELRSKKGKLNALLYAALTLIQIDLRVWYCGVQRGPGRLIGLGV